LAVTIRIAPGLVVGAGPAGLGVEFGLVGGVVAGGPGVLLAQAPALVQVEVEQD
jgi:hypothetical protein